MAVQDVRSPSAPSSNSGYPSWPQYAADEIDAAVRVLQSGKVNYWTGEESREFEREFAAYCGSLHGIALANGTIAIELALRAIGLQPGDEVVVPPRTFLATASAVVLTGGVPVFADIDRDSGNITAESIDRVISPRTKAIIPVHLGGWSCEMPQIMDLAGAKGLTVIEDCAQAHGALCEGRSVGSFGEVGAWSFCQDKIITTGGEGGMVTTDDHDLWSAMWSFKDHGKSFDAVYKRSHPPGYRWLHESFGTNWRITEPQSAIGRVQLRKLDDWVTARRRNAMALRALLIEEPGVRVPVPSDPTAHAYYRLYAYLDMDSLKSDWSRDRVVAEVAELGAPTFSGSCSEIYLEKAFDGTWSPGERLRNARELGETSLAFLTHPTLSVEHMQRVAEIVCSVLARARR